MTMWHHCCWNSRQPGMPFNKQRRCPFAKGNQEIDLGNEEPIVGSPKPRAIKLVRLQIVPRPDESRTTTAGEPKETQGGDSIERREQETFPAHKPFGKNEYESRQVGSADLSSYGKG